MPRPPILLLFSSPFVASSLRRSVALLALCHLLSAICSASAQPQSYGQWQHVGWGGGGFFFCAVAHPANPDILYVGGDVAGIYKTENAGQQWRFVNTGLPGYEVYSLAIARSAPDTLYAMTRNGLARTTNAGRSWTPLPTPVPILPHRGNTVRGLAVDPANPDIVYAGSEQGTLHKSTDGGQTWQTLPYAPPAEKNVLSAIAIRPHDPNTLFIAADKLGLFRSTDAGATWTQISRIPATSIATSPHDPRTVAAAFGPAGLMLSTDDGQSWKAINDGVALEKSAAREIAFHPTDPQVLYAIVNRDWNGTFYRSTDAGRTWKGTRAGKCDPAANPTYPQPISKLTNIALTPAAPDRVFLSCNWRNWLSTDAGLTFEERTRGADISCVYDIAFCNDKVYTVCMDEGLFVSGSNGLSWKQLYPLKYSGELEGHQWRVLVTPHNGAERILSTLSPWHAGRPNFLLRSEDGGRKFDIIREGLPTAVLNKNVFWDRGYPRALAVDPTNPNTIYLGIDGDPDPSRKTAGGGVFKSTDGGKTWTHLPNQPASRRGFFALAIDPTNPRRIYWAAGGRDCGLYRSDDGGDSWTHVLKHLWLFNVAVDRNGAVYTGFKDLLKSTDHGKTWKRLTQFTDKLLIEGLETDPRSDRVWFSRVQWQTIATGQVWRTPDGGATFQDITGELPYRKPAVLRYNPGTKELWAGGVGLFRIRQ